MNTITPWLRKWLLGPLLDYRIVSVRTIIKDDWVESFVLTRQDGKIATVPITRTGNEWRVNVKWSDKP